MLYNGNVPNLDQHAEALSPFSSLKKDSQPISNEKEFEQAIARITALQELIFEEEELIHQYLSSKDHT